MQLINALVHFNDFSLGGFVILVGVVAFDIALTKPGRPVLRLNSGKSFRIFTAQIAENRPHAFTDMQSDIAAVIYPDHLRSGCLQQHGDTVADKGGIQMPGMQRLQRIGVGVFGNDSLSGVLPGRLLLREPYQRLV